MTFRLEPALVVTTTWIRVRVLPSAYSTSQSPVSALTPIPGTAASPAIAPSRSAAAISSGVP
ncbi:hypothetical protein [Natronobacterium gregoryi]|uniref:hypothetical protein n=1 Tax=Natronobacterium gregoryi TaxID=44930 RepID=UPI001E317784|nr:hypothetical protein [Natronobacterium gregoryi]